MARYLVRCGRIPTEKLEIEDYLNASLLGSNSGNFVYLYGIVRTLTTDKDVTFKSTRYKFKFTDAQISRINRDYDGFIIPLADAFRDSFIHELEGLTELINKLTIPCYVIGAGIKADNEQEIYGDNYEMAIAVKNFVDAVLNHSSSIGIRGEITGRFLEKLGYKEGRDFTVIGCPSMYTFGNNIEIRDTVKNPDSKIAYNLTYYSKAKTIDFIDKAACEFKDPIFVSQLTNELKTLYWGIDYKKVSDKNKKRAYPCNISYPVYAQDRVRFFVNVNEWIDFMKTRDLVFGTRLHGNIPAVISGTPSILITKDMRTRELARFHGLTHVDENDLNKYKNIWELIECVDFHGPEAKQQENFENYLNFLHQNGLATIYDDDFNRVDAPFDEIIEENDVHNEFESAAVCSKQVLAERIDNCYRTIRRTNRNLEKTQTKLESTRENLKRTNNELEGTQKRLNHLESILNCKSIRCSIVVRNAFVPKKKKIKY